MGREMAVESRVLAAVPIAMKDTANTLAAQLDPFGAGHLTFRDWYGSDDGGATATHILAETNATIPAVRQGIADADAAYTWIRVVWYAEQLPDTPYAERTTAAMTLLGLTHFQDASLGLEPLTTEDDTL